MIYDKPKTFCGWILPPLTDHDRVNFKRLITKMFPLPTQTRYHCFRPLKHISIKLYTRWDQLPANAVIVAIDVGQLLARVNNCHIVLDRHGWYYWGHTGQTTKLAIEQFLEHPPTYPPKE